MHKVNDNIKRKGYKPNDKTKSKRRNRVRDHSSSTNEIEREGHIPSSTNDGVWYAQTPELMELSANIPFSQASGTSFNLEFYNDETGAKSVESIDITVPGILTLHLIPCPSSAQSATSPLNTAATKLFSFVRHANSGTPQYNSPDLMIYCVSMAQIYSYINFLQRIYGSMNIYANMNRYLPKALVECQGVNYDNILANLPNFKYGIDSLIHKAASFAVPATITYFQRLAFLFSGIYAEGESIKDQLYMFVPDGFMKFSETASETGGSLQYSALFTTNGKLTYKDLIDYGNSLLDPILQSEDMNIMSGDILKAYGDSGILKLATLPDMYMIQPTTDLTVLEQFQNASWLGSAPTTCTITQSQKGLSGSLRSNVKFPFDANVISIINGNKPLTTILTQPKAVDVMERTRLMVYGFGNSTDGITIQMTTEVPTSLHIIGLSPSDSTLQDTAVKPAVVIPATGITQAIMRVALQIHCDLENFKFHPALYYFNVGTDVTRMISIALDFDNYAIINTIDLQRMNEAALLSMFNVNSVAKAY